MKPQLVLADLSTEGYHNGDLKQTRSRIKKSAAWKKQRIVVLIPAGGSIPTKVYLSHMNLAFPPNNGVARIAAGVARIAAIGMEVGEAFSTAIENILAHPELSQWEYILTIEHDNMPPPDGVLRLLEHMEAHPEYACIGGLYFTKGHGGQPQIWGDKKDVLNFRPQPPSTDPHKPLVECWGTGMGFNLWRMDMFKDKRLRKPWFVTQKKDGIATQDLYFWMDASKYYRCAIACDVKVGHYDPVEDIVW